MSHLKSKYYFLLLFCTLFFSLSLRAHLNESCFKTSDLSGHTGPKSSEFTRLHCEVGDLFMFSSFIFLQSSH
uniref:Putative secreted protein n=1 Tax=Ixodes ricinus TaxID=34613 RepID=A0A6B0U2P2_IXORI